ncbi:MAG: PqqD family protein [Puniceicoccaceae bacterium]|nr:MAG: PqqD family protein [Puniceicoccaceae bacterium]
MNDSSPLLEAYAWMGLRLSVPAHWELRKHGVLPEAGALVWVDRYAQRLDLRWQTVKQDPDLDRMVQHRREQLASEDPDRILSELPSGQRPWRGVLYGMNPRICHALYSDPAHKVLLQLTFSLEGTREEINRLLREILATVTVAEAPAAATRWRAFGMDVRVPESWCLDSAKILPMDARLTFSCPTRRRWSKIKPAVEIRRMGMAREWFDGDLEAFARSRALDAANARLEGDPSRLRVRSSRPRFPLVGTLGPVEHEERLIRHLREQNAMLMMTLRNAEMARAGLDEVVVEGIRRAHPAGNEVPGAQSLDQPILHAIPLQNRAVALSRQGRGGVLKAPVAPRWWHRRPFRWFSAARDERGFGLDPYGLEVWEACDGERSVERICDLFAQRHDVSFHEARVAVCQFIRSLTERELVVLQLPKECLEAS